MNKRLSGVNKIFSASGTGICAALDPHAVEMHGGSNGVVGVVLFGGCGFGGGGIGFCGCCAGDGLLKLTLPSPALEQAVSELSMKKSPIVWRNIRV